MSIYFIYAEAILNNGIVVGKVALTAHADNADAVLNQFWEEDCVLAYTSQGIKVVIDKFEKVE